jgi:hypothetical protein
MTPHEQRISSAAEEINNEKFNTSKISIMEILLKHFPASEQPANESEVMPVTHHEGMPITPQLTSPETASAAVGAHQLSPDLTIELSPNGRIKFIEKHGDGFFLSGEEAYKLRELLTRTTPPATGQEEEKLNAAVESVFKNVMFPNEMKWHDSIKMAIQQHTTTLRARVEQLEKQNWEMRKQLIRATNFLLIHKIISDDGSIYKDIEKALSPQPPLPSEGRKV